MSFDRRKEKKSFFAHIEAILFNTMHRLCRSDFMGMTLKAIPVLREGCIFDQNLRTCTFLFVCSQAKTPYAKPPVRVWLAMTIHPWNICNRKEAVCREKTLILGHAPYTVAKGFAMHRKGIPCNAVNSNGWNQDKVNTNFNKDIIQSEGD